MLGVYLVDDITVIQHQKEDQWGEPLPDVKIAVKGKIEYKTRLVRDLRGEEVVSSAMVMLANRDLTHADRLKFDGIEHSILRIDKPKAFSDPHLEVYVA